MKLQLKLAMLAMASPFVIDVAAASLLPQLSTAWAMEEQDHESKNEEEHEEGASIKLTDSELAGAAVTVGRIGLRSLAETVRAPGEVIANQYATTQVTPRVEAQVLKRHARMGDIVQMGQPLVTLSSVSMAEAQAALILTELEWRRTQKLGRDIVSEQRYIEVQVAAQQAKAKVLAYGMTDEQIASLVARGDASAATGEFDLLARQDGTIIHDSFVTGQFVDPGEVLFEVSDESRIWVEAKLSPENAGEISHGAKAWVSKTGQVLPGKVVQIHHKADEASRTLSVRVELNNQEDQLHPGEFTNVEIQTGATAEMLAVPDSSIVLLDGNRVVFKRDGNAIAPVPLDTGVSKGGWTEVRSGVFAGDTIVVENAFLIKSLILKSKMGEGHGH